MSTLDHPRVLRAAGVDVVEYPGWSTRAVVNPRTGRPYAFDPVGILVHDDIIGPGVPRSTARVLAEKGRPDLHAPLYNKWVDRNGVWWILAVGNCNHAGRGDSRALARITADLPPTHNELEDIVGNTHLDSVCLANHPDFDDGHPFGQLASLEVGLAAIVAREGWTANRVIRHLEFTNRKPDARIDGAELRRRIAALIDNPRPSDDEEEVIAWL